MKLKLKKKTETETPNLDQVSAALPTPIEEESEDLAALRKEIDRVGRLAKSMAAKIKAVKDLADEEKKVKEKVLAYVAENYVDPDAEPEIAGEEFAFEVGKQANERSVTDVKKVAEMLGEDFWPIVQLKLGDLDNYLTLKQREQVIATSRGKRTAKMVERSKIKKI